MLDLTVMSFQALEVDNKLHASTLEIVANSDHKMELGKTSLTYQGH